LKIFPFSYRKFTTFKRLKYNARSLITYQETGGIPEFIRQGTDTLSAKLIDDILLRGIAIRHTIRDVESLRQLAIYLISNVGSLVKDWLKQ
jgi:predicted AAA+ superfamily ATPase